MLEESQYMVNLPLLPVDWDAVADSVNPFGDQGVFPVREIEPQINRSMLRWNLEKGDWRGISNEPLDPQSNVFRAISNRVTNFMMSSPVETGDEIRDRHFRDILADAVRAVYRDHSPIFWTDTDPDQSEEDRWPDVLDARFFFRTDSDGWVYAVPQPGNKIRVIQFVAGFYEESEYEFNGSSVFRNTKQVIREWFGPDTLVMPRDFDVSTWDEIAPHALELSRRLTANSWALGKLARPTMVPIFSDSDGSSFPRPPSTDGQPVDPTEYEQTIDRVDGIARSLARQTNHQWAALDERVTDVKILTYEAKIDHSFSQMADTRTAMEEHTAFANVNNLKELGGMPSGTALRIGNIPLVSESETVQEMCLNGLESSMEKAGLDIQVFWAPVFDVLESRRTIGQTPQQDGGTDDIV